MVAQNRRSGLLLKLFTGGGSNLCRTLARLTFPPFLATKFVTVAHGVGRSLRTKANQQDERHNRDTRHQISPPMSTVVTFRPDRSQSTLRLCDSSVTLACDINGLKIFQVLTRTVCRWTITEAQCSSNVEANVTGRHRPFHLNNRIQYRAGCHTGRKHENERGQFRYRASRPQPPQYTLRKQDQNLSVH